MRFAMTLLLVGVTLAVTWAESSESGSSSEESIESYEGLWTEESDQSVSQVEQVDPMCLVGSILEFIGCFKDGVSVNTVKCVVQAITKIVKCFSNTRMSLTRWEPFEEMLFTRTPYESQWPTFEELLFWGEEYHRSNTKSQ